MTSPPADSDQIRARLLNRLGIYDAPPPSTTVGVSGPGGSSGGSVPTSTTAPTKTQPHQPILTAAQHRRLRILRGMGVGYTFQQYSPPDGSAVRPPLNGVTPRVEPLKGSIEDDDNNNDDFSDVAAADEMKLSTTPEVEDDNNVVNSPATTAKKTTRIAFQDEVEVVPIPTRHEYSDRIKSRIWSNRHELSENAERNAVEFAAEVCSYLLYGDKLPASSLLCLPLLTSLLIVYYY